MDGNDLIDGGAGNDTLWGGNGDDTFLGGAGSDAMNGGTGTNTVDYSAGTTAVAVDLNAGVGSSGDALGDSYVNIQNVTGTAYNDSLTGSAVANLIDGGAGDDVIYGGAGNDTLLGGAGNDTISGGAGADSLDGGAGTNTLYFGTDPYHPWVNASPAGITIVLDGVTAGVGGDAAGDTYKNFTDIYMTDYNDKVTGTAANEVFHGSLGADTVIGGGGTDQMNYYWGATAGISIGLDGVAGTGGTAAGDVLTGIKQLFGTAFDDTLWGSTGNDYLYGDGGNDTFKGDAGADTLNGGTGNNTVTYAASTSAISADLGAGTGSQGDAAGDVFISIQNLVGTNYNDTLYGDANANMLTGGAGNDTLRGGLGADTLNGGTGTDTADYSDSTVGVTAYLSGAACVGGTADGDVLIGIEVIIGSAYNDSLVGSSGNETLLGGAGNDTLDGGHGADSLDGGAGIDTVTYAASTSAVTAYLDGTVGVGGDAAGDVLTNVEVLIGSSYADSLTGSAGADTLIGGSGNDTLQGGAGADSLDGGAGTDIVSYSGSAAINASFASGSLVITGGDATGDVFTSIEGVIGSANADTLTGGPGAEYLNGGLGNDTIYGSLGADTLVGGGGNDTLDYSASTAAVTAYNNAAAGGTLGVGGYADGDDASGFQTVIGSAYDDVITNLSATGADLVGNAGNDSLVGGAGADTLDGGAGNDTLVGGGGADVLIGGAGIDTASYALATGGLTASLADPTVNSGDATGDTYSGIENLTGTAYNDLLYGDANANVLSGGTGNDTLVGGAGADTLIGGGGTDVASYANAGAAVIASLANPAGNTGDAAGDSYSAISGLIGSSFNDTLTGDANANTLNGGLGNDTLIGGAGADTLTGGGGTDTADYSASSAAVAVHLDGTVGTGGDAAGDVLSGIANLVGSAYADTLYGDANANVLNGGGGNDTLIGGAGADTLIGGGGTDLASYATAGAAVIASLANPAGNTGDAAGDSYSGISGLIGSAYNDTLTGDANANTLNGGLGNDTLIGGAGADTLTGGGGTDTADYSASSAAVTVHLDGTVGTGGDAAGDVLSGIANLLGSTYNDTLFGDANANMLNGGAGNDTLIGGAGADTLIGGGGTDTADYSASAAAVTVYLNGTVGTGGDAAGDVLSGITNLVGSAFNDTLYGDANANVLNGGAGNDTLVGGAGADTLIGGGGIDVASYATATGALIASLADPTANTGDAAGDSYSGISGLIGSSYADLLFGDANANMLNGGAGNDTLVGGAGADTLTGGGGNDTADYSASTSAVTVHLDGTVGTGGDAAGDLLTGISNLVGSAYNDTLYGDANANVLNGGAGNDTLVGGAGADTLIGGGGTDTADYSASASAVSVHLDGTVGTGGDAAGDVLSGITNLVGSAFSDTLYGDTNANVLDGGAGNDTLVGGAGADTLIGGAGTDTADYSASGAAVTLDLGASGGTGSSGDANGDVLTGIEQVIGSAYNDQFTLALGNGWSIDGGAGLDTVRLAANSGTVTGTQLTGVLSHIEDIDFTSAGTAANLTVSASFIQSLVGAGNASALTINLDGNDTINIASGAFYNHTGADYTFYSDATMATQIAKLTVA